MDPVVERLVSMTPADRKWMDDMLHDVIDSWNENDPQRPTSMQCVKSMSTRADPADFDDRFKGSDDYLRVKVRGHYCDTKGILTRIVPSQFEDYVCSVLSAIKFSDFLQKSAKGNVTISGTSALRSLFCTSSLSCSLLISWRCQCGPELWGSLARGVQRNGSLCCVGPDHRPSYF
jgi:hypothetical protein